MPKEKTDLLQSIGQRIRTQRMAAGMTQLEVAEGFGCPPSRVSGIEHGTREPGTEFYVWFAKKTGVSLDSILLGRERGEKKPVALTEDVIDAGYDMISAYLNSSYAKKVVRAYLRLNLNDIINKDELTGDEIMFLDYFSKISKDKHKSLYYHMTMLSR